MQTELGKFFQELEFFLSEDAQILRKTILFGIFSKDKQQIIKQEIKAQFGLSDNFLNFINNGKKVFLANEFFIKLKELHINLKEKYKAKECIITCAKKPTKEQKTKLQKKITELNKAKKIDFRYIVDQKIIGGITIKLDGKYYDASFKNMLCKIATNIKKDIKVGAK